jgi:hypothetical protein
MTLVSELSTTSLFILDKTLRVIATGTEAIPENVGKQKLSECFMPDLSDINPHDEAIKSVLSLFGIQRPDPELKQVHQNLSFPIGAVSDNDQVKILHRLGVSGSNLNHLDQLLAYVGAPSFSSTFKLLNDQVNAARLENRGGAPIYSLGIQYSTCDNWYNRHSYTLRSEHMVPTIQQALEEGQFLLKDQLAVVENINLNCDDDGAAIRAKCDSISLYRDGIEILKFQVELRGWNIDIGWKPLLQMLSTAEVLDFDRGLMDACLAEPEWRKPEHRAFMNKIKGKAIEQELGL